ncbi:MAG TPA: YciI family protein [Thermoanaerobaculia bacterium]
MRFMIFRKADKDTEAYVMPTERLLAEMGKYMEEMANAGILLGGEGLHPSSKGSRVKFSGGKPSVTDGPFAETKELVAGYGLIQVNSLQEAIDWTKRWPAIDGDGDVELEIRQVFEAADFGEEFTPELREREERLRAQVAEQQKEG